MDLAERIGCTLTPAGGFFRVWAPHATGVAVALQGGGALGRAAHPPRRAP